MSKKVSPNLITIILDPEDTKRWCQGMARDPQFAYLSSYIGEPPELLANRLYMRFILNPNELKPFILKIMKKSYYK